MNSTKIGAAMATRSKELSAHTQGENYFSFGNKQAVYDCPDSSHLQHQELGLWKVTDF